MPLPASFLRDGFVAGATARPRMRLRNGQFLKPIMIGTEGETDSGKTEFILSCPGPGQIVTIDRSFDPLFDNPIPPAARRDDFGFKVIKVPINTTAAQPIYQEYFKLVREEYYKALSNLESLTVAVDCDSDFWELHRLASFGKLANVWPQTRYGDVYAEKRAMTARAWDSGKIIVATNKIRNEYKPVVGTDGVPAKDEKGAEIRQKTGNKERQGFPDQNYLWNVQLRHLYRPAKDGKPSQWGIRILKCKADTSLVGLELWGDDCNFAGLVQTCYPNVSLKEWGL